MNVVDSSGWLEYFANGLNSEFFASTIEDVSNLVVPTISLLEVFKRVIQQRGERDAATAIAYMQRGQIVELDMALALSAARMSLDFKLSLADSVILATARSHDALIWTQDADFKGIDGVKYVAKKPTH